jgi:hypothetical protein
MRSWTKLIALALVALGGSFANAGGPEHDYAPFVAVQGYTRTGFTEHIFDEHQFVTDDNGTKTTVDGHLILTEYRIADQTYGGELYLRKSLQEQLEEQLKEFPKTQVLVHNDKCLAGSAPLFTVRFQKGYTPVWVEVYCSDDFYRVNVAEEQAFHH